uniref:Uncharacterized protein n=1 Tax=Anguilla anguilla TaxID=7936 RepID=A0A0E9SNH5_ANGAN
MLTLSTFNTHATQPPLRSSLTNYVYPYLGGQS